ncbi:hypothetical protein E2C01_013104 [Portunus trituberculatus]|uniref:Uncharacterized protein n=1 Tax=Portunus trituberculatus TaxID=210409 RepID=A0A5B7DFC4_PORTR|nr:hypothetical protein [Portunus trituberculatus]
MNYVVLALFEMKRTQFYNWMVQWLVLWTEGLVRCLQHHTLKPHLHCLTRQQHLLQYLQVLAT